MKKSTKILSGIMALALVFTCGVGATLAYLQKEAETPVINTFSAKDLILKPSDFQLKEHVAEEQPDGSYKLTEVEIDKNSYKVVPGVNLAKDPFVRVKNVEDAYLFIEVKNELVTGMSYTMDSSWEELKDAQGTQLAGTHGGKIFVKNVGAADGKANIYVLPALNDDAQPVLFDILNLKEIVVSTEFKPEDASGKTVQLSFWGYLVQSAGFNKPLDAWNASGYVKN